MHTFVRFLNQYLTINRLFTERNSLFKICIEMHNGKDMAEMWIHNFVYILREFQNCKLNLAAFVAPPTYTVSQFAYSENLRKAVRSPKNVKTASKSTNK